MTVPEKATTSSSSVESAAPKRSLADSTPLVLPLDQPPGVPEFVPAFGMTNCHVQTYVGSLRWGRSAVSRTLRHQVCLDDGDQIVLHDNRPDDWQHGDHVVVMLHGLSGCHTSAYLMRLTEKLLAQNVRTFRMDHRGCGAGAGLATKPYHAGRIDDLHSALTFVEDMCPGSPVSVTGFSLSGNLLLKYLGAYTGRQPLSLFRAVAVCPPIDLQHCVERLQRTRMGQRYNWHFTRQLLDQVIDSPMWRDDLPLASVKRLPRDLYGFDDLFTAPASGFASAEQYYRAASSKHDLRKITTHTTILASQDDPLVCAQPLIESDVPHNVTLCITEHGGHMGFVGTHGVDPDRRWMDWRIVEWLLN